MLLNHKKLVIGYFDAHPKLVSADRMHLENQLQILSDFELRQVDQLSDMSVEETDLMVVRIGLVEQSATTKWLKSFVTKIRTSRLVWVPALILAPGFEMTEIKDLFEYAYQQNYYFDIFTSEQYEDLPLRAANLIRMHEHLQELSRYQEELKQLQERVHQIEYRLKQQKSQ